MMGAFCSFESFAEGKPAKTVDAGAYNLESTEFLSWNIHSDKASGLVILERTDEQDSGPTRGVRLCVIRITLPKSLRGETKDNIAREFCAGPNSFVQKKLFPEPILEGWKRDSDIRVSDRSVIVYGGYDRLTDQPVTNVRVIQRGVAYVWFPDSYSNNGSFFIVTGFETVVVPPEFFSDLPLVKTLLAAVKPK